MVGKLEMTTEMGLQFFGKVSASVSHEIKNVLAIINENAGLLEDFVFMANRGKPIDPARLKALAETVKKQIWRADHIIKNMNRFAHSTDETITTVDLNKTLELITALTARFAAMRSVQVDLQLRENPVKIQTAPFFLMHLIWRCLDVSLSASGDEKRIELLAEETENVIRICFRRLAGATEMLPEAFPSDREKNLLDILAADLTIDPEEQEIVLRLSKSLETNPNGPDSI